jgi:hypothetical protein
MGKEMKPTLIAAKRGGHLTTLLKPIVEGTAVFVKQKNITEELALALGYETVFECCMDTRRADGVNLNNLRVDYWLIYGKFLGWEEPEKTKFEILREKCLKAEEIARRLAYGE